MHRSLAPASIVLFALGLCACDSATGPSKVSEAPSTQSVVISLATPLVVGGSAQATAVATLSNGTTQPITTGFLSDTPTVAMVSDGGVVTPVEAGAANIYVVSGGRQGTKNIRVVPSFDGRWSGSYYVTECSQTGDFAAARLCDSFPVNRVLPYNLALSQSGESVSGTGYLGSLEFANCAATIGPGGDVALEATYQEDTGTITARWNLTSPAAGKLNGTIQSVWRDSGASGRMVLTGQIRDSMKMMGVPPQAGSPFDDAVRRWRQGIRR